MVKRLKEVFLYPLSDATWLAKVSAWLILYVFYLTIPVIALHFKAIVQRTIEEPEDESLPDIAQTVKGWGQGMKFILCALGPLSIPMFYMALHAGEASNILSSLVALSFLVYAAVLPAVVLCLVSSGDSWAAFKPKAIFQMMSLNIPAYLMLVAVPAICFGLFVSFIYVTPMAFLWLPAAPLLAMAYARALGLYYRSNAMA